MSVPEEIRNVERPCISVVVDSRSTSIYRYAVIKRVGCKVVNGMNQPVSGGTIGHSIKRGRPKKEVDPNAIVEPKRKRGRPRK